MKSLLAVVLLTCAASQVIAQDKPNAATSRDSKPADGKPMRVKMGPPNVANGPLTHTQPVYPQEAKHKKVQGTVRVHIIIGTDGKVIEASVISGDSLLRQSAVDAVRQWNYRQTLLNG